MISYACIWKLLDILCAKDYEDRFKMLYVIEEQIADMIDSLSG